MSNKKQVVFGIENNAGVETLVPVYQSEGLAMVKKSAGKYEISGVETIDKVRAVVVDYELSPEALSFASAEVVSKKIVVSIKDGLGAFTDAFKVVRVEVNM